MLLSTVFKTGGGGGYFYVDLSFTGISLVFGMKSWAGSLEAIGERSLDTALRSLD